MRIISQGIMKDIPYERFCFSIDGSRIVATDRPIGDSGRAVPIMVMAEYSSHDKAKRAMQMLHKEWADYGECGIFYFPEDEEVQI